MAQIVHDLAPGWRFLGPGRTFVLTGRHHLRDHAHTSEPGQHIGCRQRRQLPQLADAEPLQQPHQICHCRRGSAARLAEQSAHRQWRQERGRGAGSDDTWATLRLGGWGR